MCPLIVGYPPGVHISTAPLLIFLILVVLSLFVGQTPNWIISFNWDTSRKIQALPDLCKTPAISIILLVKSQSELMFLKGKQMGLMVPYFPHDRLHWLNPCWPAKVKTWTWPVFTESHAILREARPGCSPEPWNDGRKNKLGNHFDVGPEISGLWITLIYPE